MHIGACYRRGVDRDEALEALADKMIEEALAPYAGKVPEAVLQEMRDRLEDDLLIDPEGRMMLRRALEDPVVEQSGATGAAESAKEDVG